MIFLFLNWLEKIKGLTNQNQWKTDSPFPLAAKDLNISFWEHI